MDKISISKGEICKKKNWTSNLNSLNLGKEKYLLSRENIYTNNDEDFKKFKEIRVVNPFKVL